MKRLSLLFAVLVLVGMGCTTTLPQPQPEGPLPTTTESQVQDELRVLDADGAPLAENTVRKVHRIGSSPCPDRFEPIILDYPEGWGDVPLPPNTDVSWLDIPDAVTPGEPFEMKFNCNINRFDTHGEVAQVNFDFSAFAEENPGIEHEAGVPPGGTFIVVTETWDEPPVADFALPYVCCSDCGSVEYCASGE